MDLAGRGWIRGISGKGLVCACFLCAGAAVNLQGADDKASSEDVADLVESFNSSGLDIYGKLTSDKGNAAKNLIVSPYSIGMAISMALTGARGDTDAEMVTVLHQNLDRAKMDKACGKLNDTLGKMNNRELDIAVANALCLTKFGNVIRKSYKELLKRDYRTKLFDAKTVAPINAWVAEKTRGKIKKILDKLDPLSVCVLLNAVYFKGTWEQTFEVEQTRNIPFHKTSKETVDVPMMNQTNSFAVVKCAGFQALSMPFKGGNISMVVLLPDKVGGLAALEKSLTTTKLANTLSKLRKSQSRDIDLTLPKFKIKFGANLIPLFKSLGMESPFGTSADFGGMASVPPGSLYISQIQHKACVEVDEKGAVAAAATADDISVGIGGLEPSPVFRADHPFTFVIVEDETGTILFLGRVVDPAGKSKEE